MATYKGIQGYSVQSLSSDPGTLSEVVGQLWYNSTSGAFKVAVEAAAAWASGGALNTGRNSVGTAVMAPASATLAMGGGTSSPGNVNHTGATESYDGSAWTTQPASMNTARKACGGIGDSQTAAIVCGGRNAPAFLANVEIYDGSTWTEVNNLPTLKNGLDTGGAGTSTAGLMYGGNVPPQTNTNQSWDGTSWTEENDLNTTKDTMAKFGTQTAALSAGGYGDTPAAYLDQTETWDGSSWTEVNNLNTNRASLCGGGTTTLGIVFGGQSPSGAILDKTETWNGTSWTEVADLATPRAYTGGGGGSSSTTNAIAFGGSSYVDTTVEWSGAPVTAKTVTVS